MSALLPILGFALLFVAFGLARRRDCHGQCGSCGSTCTYAESRDDAT